ncbi:MAG: hypothetical protein QOK12_878 [Mycobacterium sp.]|nr:hypothetical protein [Mycobacterium sp.]
MGHSAIEPSAAPGGQQMLLIAQMQMHVAEEDVDELLSRMGDGIVGISGPGIEHDAVGLQRVLSV